MKTDRSEDRFKSIFSSAEEKKDAPITKPRLMGKQSQRSNAGLIDDSPEEYYRKNAYFPYLDFVISEMNNKFLIHRNILSSIMGLIPRYLTSFEDFRNTLEFYQDLLPDDSNILLKAEFDRWQAKWAKIETANRPSNAIDALIECNEAFFPNIFTLLKIFSTIPVSTATAERSFSTLKNLKNYLRNTMGQQRLTGLALMYIYKDYHIDTDDIFKEFKKRSRLLKL